MWEYEARELLKQLRSLEARLVRIESRQLAIMGRLGINPINVSQEGFAQEEGA